MVVRIAHANYRVRDPKATIRFWQQLGLDLIGTLNIAEGYHLFYLAPQGGDNVTIELAYRENPGEEYDFSVGAGHIALAVGDLDLLVAKLAEAGVPLTAAPFHPVVGNPLRVAFVTDPNGMKIELIEGTFATPTDKPPQIIQ